MNTTLRWVYGSSDELRELDPAGTTHPRVAIDKYGMYWFWDEVCVDMYGPFNTSTEAINSFSRYMEDIESSEYFL